MNISIILILTMAMCPLSRQVSFEKDLTLTQIQKEKLDEFRSLVKSRLPHEYMKKDIYLVRWLRARRFDIQAAEMMLLENLQWRKQNDIDNILNEDWSDFDRDFPFELQGCDKEGRLVVSVPVGDWDVRRAVVAGKSERTMRYFDRLFEQITTMIRKAQENGENMTQYNLIFEMSRYSLVLQACPLCIPIYVHFFQSYESHYPGNAHSLTLVNVPPIFLSLWQIIRPFLASDTRDGTTLYGKDKREWQMALLKTINASELTTEFGGIQDEGFTLTDVIDAKYLKCSRFQDLRNKKVKLGI